MVFPRTSLYTGSVSKKNIPPNHKWLF